MVKRSSFLLPLIYLGLALLVLGPLVRPGYIFMLDMAWTPRLPWPTEVSASFLLRVLLASLSVVIPGWVLQKILLLAILTLAGWGIHRLVAKTQAAELNPWAAYFAGVFYVVNPFTYVRFIDGHWNVLWAYSLLPFFVVALHQFYQRLDKSTMLSVVGWVIAISIVSLHTIYMVALLGLVSGVIFLWQHRHQSEKIKKFLGLSLLGSVLVLVLNSYWLVPYIQGRSAQSQLAASFDERHLLTFRTHGGDWGGVPFNLLTLHGYWGDREGRYLVPREVNPLWLPIWIFLSCLVLLGFRSAWNRSKLLATMLAGSALIAWILAMGVAEPTVAPLNRWLLHQLPFFSGYREPQKFMALIALAAAYSAGFGVDQVLSMLTKTSSWLRTGAISLILLSPFLYTPTMAWGFAGQLYSRNYPDEWYVLNRQFGQETTRPKVWFLPWHHYLSFSFAGRAVANPARNFFTQADLIQSENPEIGLIGLEGNDQNLAQRLSSSDIKYVLLAKEGDWADYSFLDQQPNLSLILDNDRLKLYQNLIYQEK